MEANKKTSDKKELEAENSKSEMKLEDMDFEMVSEDLSDEMNNLWMKKIESSKEDKFDEDDSSLEDLEDFRDRLKEKNNEKEDGASEVSSYFLVSKVFFSVYIYFSINQKNTFADLQ